MRRKVVLHGPSTLTVSLPTKWSKSQGIKKGDELEVEESGSEIRIKVLKEARPVKKCIELKELRRVGKSTITSSYRQGYDEIELLFTDPSYIRTIAELINKEITGFEIISHSKNSCVVKDITGHNKDELSVVLRRLWMLVLGLADESLQAISENSVEILRNIKILYHNINKLTNYCLRSFLTSALFNQKKTPLYYHLVKCIEEIADQYKDLCEYHLKSGQKTRNETIKSLHEVNKKLYRLYELFYHYDEKKVEDLFLETKKLSKSINDPKMTIETSICNICKDIRNLLPVLVEINI